MLLIKFLFYVHIIELENKLSQDKNEFKTMKEEEAAANKEEEAKKEQASKMEEEAKRLKEITKDMVARWWKDGGQGCSSKDVVAQEEPSCLVDYICLYG
jgi:hypothetical protein